MDIGKVGIGSSEDITKLSFFVKIFEDGFGFWIFDAILSVIPYYLSSKVLRMGSVPCPVSDASKFVKF